MSINLKSACALLVCAGILTASAQTNIAGATFQDCRVGQTVAIKCTHPLLALGKATLLEIGSNTVTICTRQDRFTLNKSDVILLPLETRTADAPSLPNNLVPSQNPGLAATSSSTSSAQMEQVLSALGGNFGGTELPISDSGSPTTLAETAKQYSSMQTGNSPQNLEEVRARIIDPYKTEAYREPKMGPDGQYRMEIDPHSPDGPKHYDEANKHYYETMAGVMNGTVTEKDLVKQAKEVMAKIESLKKDISASGGVAGFNTSMYDDKIAILKDFVRRAEAGEKFDFPVQPIP